jgi:regulator of sigma E protease
MEYGWDILWFIVGVSLLVTVHEFGHFWVARRLGFKVLRFSVGFGKPLLKKIGRAPDHTEYVIAAIPLGGYVRMLDERDGEVPEQDLPRAFTRRPPWQRILVMLAGPAEDWTRLEDRLRKKFGRRADVLIAVALARLRTEGITSQTSAGARSC